MSYVSANTSYICRIKDRAMSNGIPEWYFLKNMKYTYAYSIAYHFTVVRLDYIYRRCDSNTLVTSQSWEGIGFKYI